MAATSTTLTYSLSSLSLHTTKTSNITLLKPIKHIFFSPKFTPKPITTATKSTSDTDAPKPTAEYETIFFDNFNSEDIVFDPPTPPDDFVDPPAFDEEPMETEEEISKAYEELYGAAYSGESVLGNDVYVMDSKFKKATGYGTKSKKEKIRDGFEERVIQVRRVTKVVKGGKQLHFRAIVVVGDKQGNVGVGVGKAKEVIGAVQKSALNARRNIISVPLTKYSTFPHRSDGDYGAAKVMLRPASPGTGVIAGGAVRIVLEMAGVENALGKQIGSKNALNNARATVVAVQKMRQFRDVARERGIPMEELWK
ncbi:30S ribosomal protein S5, chloroplastic [Mercurialis annua]|uniref:30S ribosomal protein S5, chloroplastic n=1 Tax=Mercurialis annua TaxID=3986 RepID=UPI00215EBB11|nr:30S ribosomal protein S5, chloroplastic [Mercurialis annua]